MKTVQTGNKLALFILALSSAVGGILVVVLMQVGLPVHTTAIAATQNETESLHTGTTIGEPTMVPLNSFVVALNEPGEPRYLKITIAAEAGTVGLKNEIEARRAEVRDVLIPYFASLSLSTTRGIRAKQQIRSKTKHLINTVITTGQIERVFIFEFITQ